MQALGGSDEDEEKNEETAAGWLAGRRGEHGLGDNQQPRCAASSRRERGEPMRLFGGLLEGLSGEKVSKL